MSKAKCSQPLKIAFLTWEYPPNVAGGAGKYAQEITKRLAEEGHKVFVFSRKPLEAKQRNLIVLQVPYINFPFLRVLSFWLSLVIVFIIADHQNGRFNIVHTNEYVDFLMPKLLTRSAIRILTVHHLAADVISVLQPNWFDRLRSLSSEIGIGPILEKQSIKRADHIVTVSKHSKYRLVQKYNVSEDIVSSFYNGFDWGEKKERKSEQLYNQRIQNQSIKILFVGRLEERKGLSFLLKSFAKARRSTRYNLTLEIVGAGNSKAYQELANSLRIKKSVKFRGYLPEHDLKNMYRIADIFIMPSRLEGFGLVLLEAMNYGLPIICTDRGGMPEVASRYTKGFIVKFGDEEALATKICEVADAICDNRLPKSNVDKLRQVFSWKNHAQSLIELYKSLIGGEISV